jgi:ABC-type uncharacterized transport system permease subunit
MSQSNPYFADCHVDEFNPTFQLTLEPWFCNLRTDPSFISSFKHVFCIFLNSKSLVWISVKECLAQSLLTFSNIGSFFDHRNHFANSDLEYLTFDQSM